MFANFSTLLVHFVGAALACAQLAYWSIRVMTAPPMTAPAPAKSVSVTQPDPSLVARAFGLIESASVGGGNIQVAGVFAAGRDSAAVMIVNDRPARAVLLGQDVAPGSRLVDVGPQGVTLESDGVRRQLRVPGAPMANMSAPAPGAAFERRGNVLSAPSLDAAATAARAAPARGSMAALPGRAEPPPGPARPAPGASPTAQ